MKNIPMKILAVVLSIFFWIFIASIENTIIQVQEPIPISVFNQSDNLALVAYPGTVRVTVRSDDQGTFRTLGANDFEAYIDVRNVAVGVHEVPVIVNVKDPNVRIAKIIPARVSIELEPKQSKVVPLNVSIEGQPSSGYRVASKRLSQDRVNLRGAQSVLGNIGSAQARVKLDGNEQNNVTKIATVVIINKQGNIIEGLNVVDPISVEIELVEIDYVKAVGVRAQFVGKLEGVIKKVSTTPAAISISGKRDIIDPMNVVLLEEIDLSGKTKTFEIEVPIIVSEGVSLVDTETVLVEVEIELLQGGDEV